MVFRDRHIPHGPLLRWTVAFRGGGYLCVQASGKLFLLLLLLQCLVLSHQEDTEHLATCATFQHNKDLSPDPNANSTPTGKHLPDDSLFTHSCVWGATSKMVYSWSTTQHGGKLALGRDSSCRTLHFFAKILAFLYVKKKWDSFSYYGGKLASKNKQNTQQNTVIPPPQKSLYYSRFLETLIAV